MSSILWDQVRGRSKVKQQSENTENTKDMDSDHSRTEPAQAFVRMVDTEVKGQKPFEKQYSFDSSISSLDIDENRESPKASKIKIEQNYGDEAAGAMSKTLKEQGSKNITDLLVERVSLIESITWLGRHIPHCVIRDLTKDVIRIHKKKESLLTIPHAQTYAAALLFVDMSGFTKLSQLLDLESLSRFINLYFQKIIDEVINHGGDVLKFAGDAIFAEWRINGLNTDPKDKQNEIYQCVHSAATCGAEIVSKCSDYPVFNSDGIQISTLNVHCGLAYGKMAGVHVGNDYNRREFVVLGDSINQVTEACDFATYGELMASPEAYKVLIRNTPQRRLFRKKSKEEIKREPVLIAARKEIHFEKKKKKKNVTNRGRRRSITYQKQEQEFSIPFDMMDITCLKYLQKLISLYVHPVVVADERTSRSSQREVSAIQERHRSEAELRSVYTIFIKPVVHAELTNDPAKNKATFKVLNNILDTTTSVLDGFRGHLRQFIVDDKGVILIATFGLRGSTSPNMAAERVLPAARTIHYALQNDLGIVNYIGITLGKVYCGVVGGIKRHEFAVLGPSVNLSARLLSMQNHPGILINDDVRQEAMKWGSFLSFPPMKAKGYSELVPVYQPLTAVEARWGKVNPRFVGRRDEMKRVCKLAQEMVVTKGPAKMFFVWGETGSGKSDFLVQTIALMRKKLITMKKGVMLTRNVGSEGDSLVPFSLFRSVFRDLLSDNHVSENTSILSKTSKYDTIGSIKDRDFESLSIASMSTMNTLQTVSIERLKEICDELGAPRGFLQIVGHHLLGHAKSNFDSTSKQKAPILKDIVDFMAKVFIHCTSSADLTIVALDDMHYIDNMSWKVIQKIFETGENILFVCGSRTFGSRSLVDEEFWSNLNETQRECGRFRELEIGPLHQGDIAKMVSIVFSCEVEEVDSQFVKDIFDHTRGMPHFAYQALQSCKRKKLHERLENNKIGWNRDTAELNLQFSTLDELLLQRIDDLDDFTRKILHLASVLGHDFSLMEIIGISEHILSIGDGEEEKSSHRREVNGSLNLAIDEGILDHSPDKFDVLSSQIPNLSLSTFPVFSKEGKENGNVNNNQDFDVCFLFCHDTWRQKILSLLLDSYKQDIHGHAASVMEQNIPNIEESDYRTKLRLFGHLKGSRNTTKAAELAVDVGKNFMHLGLNPQSIRVYDEALDMWRRSNDNNQDNSNNRLATGFTFETVESLEESDLISVLSLLTASGQALGTLGKKAESCRAFQDALEIFKISPIRSEIRDRSILFPLYSGLFFLFKFGGMVDPSEATAYEHNLVTNFVEETRLHGDPVHYSRSLAMQAEFYTRQGQYEDALYCHEKLKRVYDVKKHSTLVIKAYASDRSAQNYGNGANCLYRLGRVEESLELSSLVIDHIMPQMDLKNVHNSMIMIYPILWILQSEKLPKRALLALEQYVFEPFRLYFGDKGKSPLLVLYKPLKALFSILMFTLGEIESFDDSLIPWASQPDTLNFVNAIDNAMANYGRCGSSIGAEVCLLLSKHTDEQNASKKQLIEKGWILAQKAMKTATKIGLDQTSYFMTKPLYDELSTLFESIS